MQLDVVLPIPRARSLSHPLAPLLPFAFDSQRLCPVPLPSPCARNFKRLKRLVPPESLIKLMEYFHAYVCLPPYYVFTARCSLCLGTSLFPRVLRVAKAVGNAPNSFASFHSTESFDSLFAMEFPQKNRLN